jgi:hypothetical protein
MNTPELPVFGAMKQEAVLLILHEEITNNKLE